MLKFDALVIGCGLSGAVLARHLAEKGKNVLMIERRNHIGGNMYDYVNSDGILVHKYGPHTFHTNREFLMSYIILISSATFLKANSDFFMISFETQ